MINNIEDGIAYIHSLPKVHTNSDLDAIKKTLQAFNNPQNDYDVIHITGTNGKGSVAHFTNEMLVNSGYTVGMFTSPYIVEFNERFQINGEFISDSELLTLINEIKEKVVSLGADFYLVEFEFVTVLGLLYFSNQQVDVAVIEVGIGGTHDKTNVVESVISVINNVGLDHKQLIGPTLADIAREKSGIIKQNNQVILGNIDRDLLPIFIKKAQQTEAHIQQLKTDFDVQNIIKNEQGFTFDFVNASNQITGIRLASIADFQIANVAVAIETFMQYQNYRQQNIDAPTVIEAIGQVQMLARMQIVHQQPLVILDGAHNEHAAHALVKALDDFYPYKKIKFLIAMMKDKEFNQVIDIFSDKSSDITLTTFAENRSLKEDDITDHHFIPDWETFVSEFLKQKSDEILVVTGSLHFTSNVLHYFQQK